jgi:hypothetical protein
VKYRVALLCPIWIGAGVLPHKPEEINRIFHL